ncbi:DUF732 domain-containing protein [Mycolicibacterium bacteremicum]|uniref:DUF732 domain-containing protein n=1 Tax=Mycolicibacterium bacteremicum TaxID=564198 RepID=A0A1W9YS74_MYCBA|nr:DUF732 domain-containing protein [Mycolicibacterium bacteremicum]MCV7432741.1 DUF732 domain-containing protein [Mycolicibacterium bacteremicum]ORA02807.1 hypothetical protein BST17_22070 [Mycolicibacterium bacteremicum]
MSSIATFATKSAVAAAALALAVSTAGAGWADSVDDTYLTNVYAEGISYPSDVDAIDDALLVCDYLAAGRNGTDISVEIMNNSDLSPQQAATIVVEASAAYCPRFFDQVTA